MVRLTVLAAIFLAAFMSESAAGGALALNTSNTPPYANDQGTGFQDLLVAEAFRRIGEQVSFHHVQAERALVNVNKGIDDGNLIRVAGLTRIYPNIRQVPEKLFEYEFVVFARDRLFQPNDWGSLAPLRVAFIRGWKILEENVTQARSITRAPDEQQLFALLESDAADAVIYERWRGQHMVKAAGLKDIRALEPPLAKREMFIYLHKRHEALIPKLAAALREMKKDGAYDRIFERALRPYVTR